MSAHCEFGPVNSDSIFWRVWPATPIVWRAHEGCLTVNKACCLFSHLLIDFHNFVENNYKYVIMIGDVCKHSLLVITACPPHALCHCYVDIF